MKKLSILILMIVVCIGLMASVIQATGINDNTLKDRDPTGPYNLMAALVNCNDVLLMWENPDFINLPMGFRIYCNNSMVNYIPGTDVTDCLMADVCNGCHQFYVVAFYDTGCESEPSNIAEITISSNSDELVSNAPLALNVYPNPARKNVNIALAGSKINETAILSVFNTKGQLIRQLSLKGDAITLWDGKDNNGKRMSEGIYFLRASSSLGNAAKKLILTK